MPRRKKRVYRYLSHYYSVILFFIIFENIRKTFTNILIHSFYQIQHKENNTTRKIININDQSIFKNKMFFGIVTVNSSYERRKFTWEKWLKDAYSQKHFYAFASDSQCEDFNTILTNNFSIDFNMIKHQVSFDSDDYYDEYDIEFADDYPPLDISYENDSNSDEFDFINETAYQQFLNKSRELEIANKMKFLHENVDRAFKRLTLLDYFLKNTTAKYALISTDDIIIQTDRLEWFIKELDKKVLDSEKEVRVYGDCHSFEYSEWLQGGIGYIFTRAAASLCLEKKEQWMEGFSQADDVEFTRLLQLIGVPMKDTEVSYLIGHTIENIPISQEFAEECPNLAVYLEDKCGRGLHPLSDVIGYHQNDENGRESNMQSIRSLQKESDHFYWYNKGFSTRVCYKK